MLFGMPSSSYPLLQLDHLFGCNKIRMLYSKNVWLTSLDLSNNSIGDAGALAIGDYLGYVLSVLTHFVDGDIINFFFVVIDT